MAEPRVSTPHPLYPDTPKERELRKQINDLQSKVVATRAHYEQQIAAMRAAKSDPAARQALDDAQRHVKGLSVTVERLQKELEAAKFEHERLEARIKAGAERRKYMVYVLNALLVCEDSETMSDDEYDARMGAVVRRARALVSAEKAAILAAKGEV